MVQPVLAGFFTRITMTVASREPSPNILAPSRLQASPRSLAFPRRSKQYTSVNSSCRHARMPASVFPLIHDDGVMNPITPDSPIRSRGPPQRLDVRVVHLHGVSLGSPPDVRVLDTALYLRMADVLVVFVCRLLPGRIRRVPYYAGDLSRPRCLLMRLLGPAITSPACSSKFPGLNVSVNDSPSNCWNVSVP